MKNFALISVTFLLIISPIFSFAGGDDILGTWLVENKSTKIEFYKCGDKYCGKIVWMDDTEDHRNTYGTPFLDINNPDKKKQSQELVGSTSMLNFEFDADDGKYNGKAYKYSNGKTYSGYMKMQEDGTLYMKGGYKVLGMLVGESQIWTRTK